MISSKLKILFSIIILMIVVLTASIAINTIDYNTNSPKGCEVILQSACSQLDL